jgi:hypothetical protein
VNKTNVAEAKAGVNLTDIDIDKVVKDEDDDLKYIKKEDVDDDDAGMGQLAELLKQENQEDFIKAQKPKNDAIAAILAAAGVEYTHENSEVVGSSKVEEQLSKRAELAAVDSAQSQGAPLFMDEEANDVPEAADMKGFRFRFNPPPEVIKRQFCSMAKEFGFQSATDFALVVESWTTEQRRNCLDAFYKRRDARLLELELESVKKDEVDEKDTSMDMKEEDIKHDDVREKRYATQVRVKDEVSMDGDSGLDRAYIKAEEEISNNISRLSREIKALKEERAVAELVKVEHDEDDEDDEL